MKSISSDSGKRMPCAKAERGPELDRTRKDSDRSAAVQRGAGRVVIPVRASDRRSNGFVVALVDDLAEPEQKHQRRVPVIPFRRQ